MQKTKIICTVGPTSSSVEILKELIEKGADAFRLNFSHETHETHLMKIQNIREARNQMNVPIPIILDTKGPEVRIGVFQKDKISLKEGDTFVLTTRECEGNERQVSISYAGLPKDVAQGSVILVDDGLLALEVISTTDTDITCRVLNNASISSRKGVNVPGVYLNIPFLTERDKNDLLFGIEQDVDYVAASFVRRAKDVVEMRKFLQENGGGYLKIISKIENQDGVQNIDEILEVSDGIMVARGDLGVEIPTEVVPLVQKALIAKANAKSVPVITATQMLDSMIRNPRPTRAEASDVANAIYDGSDAIMLSGETANGAYPIESVATMSRIADAIEHSDDYKEKMEHINANIDMNITNAISHAACVTARELGATCVVTVTHGGSTANLISKFRPCCPIVASTVDQHVCRQMNLYWGVYPVLAKEESRTEMLFRSAVKSCIDCGLAKDGDIIVITAGVPLGISGSTNILKVHTVGNVIAKGKGVGKDSVFAKPRILKVVDQAKKGFNNGDILVAYATNNDYLPYMKKASAIIVEDATDPEENHAVIVARALDIPVVYGTKDAVELISRFPVITVDPERGFIFNGHPGDNNEQYVIDNI